MQIRRAVAFLRENLMRVLVISALLLAPCFWHRHLEAGDVPSHTYNAWLAHLIDHGQAPGLYFQSRWNNFLTDVTVQRLGETFGYIVAERILVATTVLIFFWGAFSLISTATGHPPWFLMPAIAMITYGWTFYSGFMNFYFSVGLAFFAAALGWRGRGTDWLAVAVLALLAFFAHPLGFLCLVGMAAYFKLSELLRGWLRWVLFGSAFLIIVGVHYYMLRFNVAWWHTKDFYELNGADQLVLFSARYEKMGWAAALIGGFCFLFGVIREWKSREDRWIFRAPLELWAVLMFTAAMIPEVMFLPQYAIPFAFIVSRLTIVTGVLGLCILGSVKPRAWHFALLGICAAVFFVWSYQDTGMLSGMEDQIGELVRPLPYGRRVIETINLAPGSRLWFVNHMVDRACIGHCFAFGNYEPTSGQFRIRARHGSPVNTDSAEDNQKMESGYYVVRPEDLPMNEIYQCDEKNLGKMCMRELGAGEENGRIGYRPPIQ